MSASTTAQPDASWKLEVVLGYGVDRLRAEAQAGTSGAISSTQYFSFGKDSTSTPMGDVIGRHAVTVGAIGGERIATVVQFTVGYHYLALLFTCAGSGQNVYGKYQTAGWTQMQFAGEWSC